MILDDDQVVRLYRRLAPLYDVAVTPFTWLGLCRHRAATIQRLQLKPGDVVLDMGCGTGLNFPKLHDAVGANGRIIGVDISPDMLARAQRRIERYQVPNVELIQADLATYSMPPRLDGVLATFALEMVPAYDSIIRRVASTLPRGGQIASYGLKHPEGWPAWLIALGVWLTKPFGVSSEYESFRPYESIRRHLHEVDYRKFFLERLTYRLAKSVVEVYYATPYHRPTRETC